MDPMKRLAFILALVFAASPAIGQRADGKEKGKWQGTSKEERQRMRDDMRAYKAGDKGAARQGQRQMSPEQRESLRRDMQDANRNAKKR
jgi:hypothetical protein